MAPRASHAEDGAAERRQRDEYVDVSASGSAGYNVFALGLAIQYRFPPQIAAGLTGRLFAYPALALDGVSTPDGSFVARSINTGSLSPSVRWDFLSSRYFRAWLGAEAGPGVVVSTGDRRVAADRYAPGQSLTWGLVYGFEAGLAARPHEVFSFGVVASTHRASSEPLSLGMPPLLLGVVLSAHVPIRKSPPREVGSRTVAPVGVGPTSVGAEPRL